MRKVDLHNLKWEFARAAIHCAVEDAAMDIARCNEKGGIEFITGKGIGIINDLCRTALFRELGIKPATTRQVLWTPATNVRVDEKELLYYTEKHFSLL